MTKFPNPRAARLQALLAALASWMFVLWLAGLPFAASQTYIFAGLYALAALWLTVIAISFQMKCPNCGKSVAITQGPTRLGADWTAIRKQFFPAEALLGRPSITACPHCSTNLLMPNPSFKRTPDGAA
jgi:hypothetical protein